MSLDHFLHSEDDDDLILLSTYKGRIFFNTHSHNQLIFVFKTLTV